MNKHLIALKRRITRPLIADLLEHRAIGWAVLGAAGLQAGLVSLDLPGWPCLFRHTLGVPCPGCGLSRAIAALLHGDWEATITYHAFAPLVLLLLLVVVGASLMPNTSRQWLISRVAGLEHRLGFGALGLVGMFAYWLIRLLFYHNSYIVLIMG